MQSYMSVHLVKVYPVYAKQVVISMRLSFSALTRYLTAKEHTTLALERQRVYLESA